MDVKINELRMLTNMLLDNLEKSGHSTIALPHDYYWSVPKQLEYDPYKEPTSLTLGQLSDDLIELESVARGEKEPVAYALVWLASILRAIGQDLVT
ncbi:MAG: hypothetical protein AB7O62_25530 [Pirellulales bacterium]